MMAVPKQGGIVDGFKRSIGLHKSNASEDVKLNVDHFKCVFVGDGSVRKSTLLRRFREGEYIDIFEVTSGCNQFSATVKVGGKHVQLNLWDTPGIDDLDRVRPALSYPQTDVFLICYSVEDHSSYQNVLGRWYPEVIHHCPNVPIVLLANRIDLRNDPEAVARLNRERLAPLTYTQGLEMKEKIGAVAYAECSALTNEGVNALFEEVIPAAAMSAARKQKGKKKKNDSLKK